MRHINILVLNHNFNIAIIINFFLHKFFSCFQNIRCMIPGKIVGMRFQDVTN